MKKNRLQERIEVNPGVMAGKPVIQGTRIPVDLLARMVAQGISETDILREYPRLQAEDMQAALMYAAGERAPGAAHSADFGSGS